MGRFHKIGISVGDAQLKSFKAKYFFQFLSVEVKYIAKAYFFSFIPLTSRQAVSF
jgi:hypothetical protein